jgi:hypothetical protein
MKKHVILCCIILLVLLCGVGNAKLIPQSISDLTLGSDVIVYGKIIDVQSALNTEKTHIETTAKVLVNDTFMSGDTTSISSGSIITITVPGGTLGDKTEWVEDTPSLIKDSEAILFLKKTGNEKYSVISLYRVTEGKIGAPFNVTSSEPANDVASFKQKITAIVQGNVSNLTRPGVVVPTTAKAPLLFAPVISIIAIMLIYKKILR